MDKNNILRFILCLAAISLLLAVSYPRPALAEAPAAGEISKKEAKRLEKEKKKKEKSKRKAQKAAEKATYKNTSGEIRRGVSPADGLKRTLKGEFKAEGPPEGGIDQFIKDWTAPVDQALLATAPEKARLTWLGHSSMLLQVEEANILIDPVFSKRIGPRSMMGNKRVVPSPITVDELPRIDVVLISHNHFDHLDYKTVVKLRKKFGDEPLWLVPAGMKPWFKRRGINNVREMNWWESEEAFGLTFYFTPVQHWSKRSVGDNNDSLWGGFMVEKKLPKKSWKFLYVGDTGYSEDFKETRRRLGAADFLAVPVGSYEPRESMNFQHIKPEEAVKIIREVVAKQALGVHWGTFEKKESFDRPPKDVKAVLAAQGLPQEAFWFLKQGESRNLSW